MNEDTSLRVVIGTRVAALREAAGKRQEDLAAAAREVGLAWSRSRIASLERGEKAISAEELILLPWMLTTALDRHHDAVSYAELFDLDVRIPLTGDYSIAAREVPEVLAGRDGGEVFEVEQELTGAFLLAYGQIKIAEKRAVSLGLNKASNRDVIQVERTETEAEEKAARRLGESRYLLTRIYGHVWGRSLTAERDARVLAALPAEAPPSTVQAKRGRVTRELVAEIQAFIAEREGQARGKR